uniref:RRM domain-containing protein n=1 Tax=Ditylenchus dipsaci TaxID=166011 RepID=A0A915ECY5_9BILA
MLKGKNQAFVEYESESSAQSLVNVAEACPMAIRGRTIFCQFSTHQELKTDRKAATKDGYIFGGEEISASTGSQWQEEMGLSVRGTAPSPTAPVAIPIAVVHGSACLVYLGHPHPIFSLHFSYLFLGMLQNTELVQLRLA